MVEPSKVRAQLMPLPVGIQKMPATNPLSSCHRPTCLSIVLLMHPVPPAMVGNGQGLDALYEHMELSPIESTPHACTHGNTDSH